MMAGDSDMVLLVGNNVNAWVKSGNRLWPALRIVCHGASNFTDVAPNALLCINSDKFIHSHPFLKARTHLQQCKNRDILLAQTRLNLNL